jgi:hypothetical protein
MKARLEAGLGERAEAGLKERAEAGLKKSDCAAKRAVVRECGPPGAASMNRGLMRMSLNGVC